MNENQGSEPGRSSARMVWIGTALGAVVILLAVISYRASAESHAAPGSPLYARAVHEALQGLAGKKAGKPVAGQPPLPAGLSPHEYYWCAKCESYHKRQPEGVVAPGDAATPPPAANQPAGSPPPLPEGFSPADYYWCEKCRAYHQRQPAQPAPVPPVPAPPVPTPQPPAPPAPALPAPSDEGPDKDQENPAGAEVAPAG